MWTVMKNFLCTFVVVIAQDEVNFKADMPYLRVDLNDPADLECCYTTNVESLELTWVIYNQFLNTKQRNLTKNPGHLMPRYVNASDRVTMEHITDSNPKCGTLSLKSVQLNDAGLYKCLLNKGNISLTSHGTFLQVNKPLQKTINLSENTKNKILTAEGVLLLLCVLLPAISLLYQSKRLNELEKKKVEKEEENIYQGLNLDDCCATYDQIQRSQTTGPYQDLCNSYEEEEEIQLEKP